MHFPVWTQLAEDLAFELQLNEIETVSIFIICKISLIIATIGLGPMADFVGRGTINLWQNTFFILSSVLFISYTTKFTLYLNILLVATCTNNGQNNECVSIQESVKQSQRYAVTGISQVINILGLFIFIMVQSQFKSWKIAQLTMVGTMTVALILRLFTTEGHKWLFKVDKIGKCVESINQQSIVNNDGFQILQWSNEDLVFINSLVIQNKFIVDAENKIIKFNLIKRFSNLDQSEKYKDMDINEWVTIDQINSICSYCDLEKCQCIQIIRNQKKSLKSDKSDTVIDQDIDNNINSIQTPINQTQLETENTNTSTPNYIFNNDISFYVPSKSIADKQINIGKLPGTKNWPIILNLILQNMFIPVILWTWVEQIPDYLTETKKQLSMREFHEISAQALLATFTLSLLIQSIILCVKGQTKVILAIHILVLTFAVVIMCVPAVGELKQIEIGMIAMMFGFSAIEQSIVFYIQPMTSSSDFRSTVFNLYELSFAFFATFWDIVLQYGVYPQFKIETLWANILIYIPIFQFVIMVIQLFGDKENDDLEE